MPVSFSRRSLLRGAGTLGLLSLGGPVLARGRRPFFGPGGETLGLQLYTLGEEWHRNLDATFQAVRAIGYGAVELLGWGRNDAAAVKAALDRAGLVARSMQTGFQGTPNLRTGLDRIIADANLLGLEHVVASMPDLPVARYGGPKPGEAIPAFIGRVFSRMTVDEWRAYADLLNGIGGRLRPHGLKMVHHNHNFEFLPVGDTTAYDIIQRHTDPALVFFELDAGWVKAAGLDPVAILERYPGRFRLMHVKDITPATRPNYALQQDPAIVGEGVMDWTKILPAARKAGITGYYVEQEPPFTIPRLDAARRNHDYLSTLRV